MLYSENLVHGTELTSENFYKVTDLFRDLKHHLSIKGVITGVVPGRVFLSNDCSTVLLTNPQGIFLGGSAENTLFFQEINKLLKEEILPTLASNGELDYVLFYPLRRKWELIIDVIMEGLLPMKSGRMTFIHDLSDINTFTDSNIYPIDCNLLKQHNLIGIDAVTSEILDNWPSLEAYEEKGFGFVAIQNMNGCPTIISWCLTDWVVEDECELGIETDENCRGKGWARKTALATLSLAKQKGIKKVGWQCWANNIGSQRTALSVGFKLLTDFPVLFGWNHPLNNLLVNGNHYMFGDMKYGVQKDYARAAWSYAQALDQDWDWNGDAALYWNAACCFYLIDEKERAKQYYKKALKKGWINIHSPHYHEYVYREPNSEEITRILN
ncbi:acetyltransferase [Bacillus manliponensis]|uniref:Acetyltransferase n=1 Tax=Bacillus manliponensis TaxID=574376 RepID=A0A073JZN6_9BACI|nr:GNAT family N-acetyltransferase [Bacillus manliponensis]KEK19710.1 acetyltransferase [Bacillus manliponensis]